MTQETLLDRVAAHLAKFGLTIKKLEDSKAYWPRLMELPKPLREELIEYWRSFGDERAELSEGLEWIMTWQEHWDRNKRLTVAELTRRQRSWLVTKLGLPVPAVQFLQRHHILTAGDLLLRSATSLRKLEGFDEDLEQTIEAALVRLSWRLAAPSESSLA